MKHCKSVIYSRQSNEHFVLGHALTYLGAALLWLRYWCMGRWCSRGHCTCPKALTSVDTHAFQVLFQPHGDRHRPTATHWRRYSHWQLSAAPYPTRSHSALPSGHRSLTAWAPYQASLILSPSSPIQPCPLKLRCRNSATMTTRQFIPWILLKSPFSEQIQNWIANPKAMATWTCYIVSSELNNKTSWIQK